MNSKCCARFLHIVMAAMILGGLSPALLRASYPILILDFSN
jgi:hypothetical protein